jgi:hypothetical protein
MAAANVINKHIASGVISLDEYDGLTAKLAMLSANLSVISGDGFNSFNGLNNEIQQNYIWGCATLADECRAIIDRNTGI